MTIANPFPFSPGGARGSWFAKRERAVAERNDDRSIAANARPLEPGDRSAGSGSPWGQAMNEQRDALLDECCEGFEALATLGQAALDALPEAVYVCAPDGRVLRFNRKAVELWGRTPQPGDPRERFCGSLRLYNTDGNPLPRDQWPVATALRTGQSVHGQEVVVERPDGRRLTVLVNVAPLEDKNGRVSGAVNCFQDITGRKQEQDRERRLVAELEHRVKNTFAAVHSLVANTAGSATSVDDFAERLKGRLLALGRAHTVLSQGDWKGAKLRDLLAQQLGPFAGEASPRIRLQGPEIDLQPRLASALSLMVHELMINAAKYGALSVDGGTISIEWDLQSQSEGERRLALHWNEAGGPPVVAPQHTGFGTRLIRAIAKGEDGQADLLFEPSGLRVQASIPLRG